MAISFRVKNLSGQPYLLLGLDVEGSVVQSHVPTGGTWHHLYDDVGLNYRRNNWDDIRNNVDLRKGVLDGDLEVDYQYNDVGKRGATPEADLIFTGGDASSFLTLGQSNAVSPPYKDPQIVPDAVHQIVIDDDGDIVSNLGAVARCTWTLPDYNTLTQGWSVHIRNDSTYLLEVVGNGIPINTFEGPQKNILLPNTDQVYVYIENPIQVWLTINVNAYESVAESTGLNFAGRVRELADLPPAPGRDYYAIVADDGVNSGTYYDDGVDWVRLGNVPKSPAQFITFTGSEFITEWAGVWSAGTYQRGAMVLDGNWLMVCNTETADRAGPVSVAPAAWYLNDLTPWLESTTVNSPLIIGHRYQSDIDAYVNSIRYYVETPDPNLLYRFWATKNPITNREDIFLGSTSITTSGWYEVYFNRLLVLTGEVFDVYVNVVDVNNISTFAGDWNYTRNNSNPSSGQIRQNTNGQEMRVHYFDDAAVDRSADLATLTVGDEISAGGADWTITSITDNPVGQFYEFGVQPTATLGNSIYVFNFVHYGPGNIAYPYITNFWPDNGVTQIWGIFQSGDYNPAGAVDGNGYGIDVFIEEIQRSGDWDLISYSGVDVNNFQNVATYTSLLDSPQYASLDEHVRMEGQMTNSDSGVDLKLCELDYKVDPSASREYKLDVGVLASYADTSSQILFKVFISGVEQTDLGFAWTPSSANDQMPMHTQFYINGDEFPLSTGVIELRMTPGSNGQLATAHRASLELKSV